MNETEKNFKDKFPSLIDAGFMEHLESGNVKGVLNIMNKNCLDMKNVEGGIDASIMDLGIALSGIFSDFDASKELSDMITSFKDMIKARVNLPDGITLDDLKEYRASLIKNMEKK